MKRLKRPITLESSGYVAIATSSLLAVSFSVVNRRISNWLAHGSVTYFTLALVTLLTFVLSEKTPDALVPHGFARLGLATAAGIIVWYYAWVVSRAMVAGLRGEPYERATCLSNFRRLQNSHLFLWSMMGIFVIQILKWPQLVRMNWGLGGLILIDELAIVAPIVLTFLLSWGAFFDVEVELRDLSADRRNRFAERLNYVWLESRNSAALILVPVLLMLSIRDVITSVAPQKSHEGIEWIAYGASALILFAFFPFVLSAIWSTKRLHDCRLHGRLRRMANDCGIGLREIRVWHTGHRAANAVIAGFLPGTRFLFLSDRLLATLNAEEIEAVVAHELGHVKQFHILWRAVTIVAPVVTLGVVAQRYPAVHVPTLWMELFGAVVLFLWIATNLAWVSRRSEHWADVWACRFLSRDSGPDHATSRYVAALGRLHRANGKGSIRGGWLHPSLPARVTYIHRTLGLPMPDAIAQT